MPKTNIHIASSVRKTGKGYEQVHGFVDLESKKPQRHDITKMVDYSSLKRYLGYHREIQALMGN